MENHPLVFFYPNSPYMPSKNILLISIFSLFVTTSTACSCKWGGNFLKNTTYGDLILKVKIISTQWHFENGKTIYQADSLYPYLDKVNLGYVDSHQSIDAEIIEVIKGEEHRKVIRIFGSDGADCREPAHLLKVDQFYLLNLDQIQATHHPSEKTTDYTFGGCYESWISYLPKENNVYGYIIGKGRSGKRKIAYDKLLSRISSK